MRAGRRRRREGEEGGGRRRAAADGCPRARRSRAGAAGLGAGLALRVLRAGAVRCLPRRPAAAGLPAAAARDAGGKRPSRLYHPRPIPTYLCPCVSVSHACLCPTGAAQALLPLRPGLLRAGAGSTGSTGVASAPRERGKRTPSHPHVTKLCPCRDHAMTALSPPPGGQAQHKRISYPVLHGALRQGTVQQPAVEELVCRCSIQHSHHWQQL